MNKSRRQFLTDSSKTLASITLSPLVTASVIPKKGSANEKINIALIGAKSQGFADLRQALKQPNVECVAICDIDDAILNQRTDEVSSIKGKKPLQYKDFRK